MKKVTCTQILTVTFVGMFVYGAATGAWGAALMALGMAGFVYWADGYFDRQNRAWLLQRKRSRDTLTAMADDDGECSGSYM